MRMVTRGLCTSFVVWFSIPAQADSGFTVSVKKVARAKEEGRMGGTAEWEGALPPLSGPRKLTKACYFWLLLLTTLPLRLQLPPPLRCQARKQTSSSATCCNFCGWSGGHAPTGAEGGRWPLSHPSVHGCTRPSACYTVFPQLSLSPCASRCLHTGLLLLMPSVRLASVSLACRPLLDSAGGQQGLMRP